MLEARKERFPNRRFSPNLNPVPHPQDSLCLWPQFNKCSLSTFSARLCARVGTYAYMEKILFLSLGGWQSSRGHRLRKRYHHTKISVHWHMNNCWRNVLGKTVREC